MRISSASPPPILNSFSLEQCFPALEQLMGKSRWRGREIQETYLRVYGGVQWPNGQCARPWMISKCLIMYVVVVDSIQLLFEKGASAARSQGCWWKSSPMQYLFLGSCACCQFTVLIRSNSYKAAFYQMSFFLVFRCLPLPISSLHLSHAFI